MDRRSFLAGSGVLAASHAFGAAAEAGPFTPGLQLFTVRAHLEQDFEGTLRAVADIGYREVETIGAFGRDPAWVRDVLGECGLVTPSQHLMSGELSIDRIDSNIGQAVARASVLGQRYIVWPVIGPEQMATRQLTLDFARAMNRAGEICAKAGLVFCFHNHAAEMKRAGGFVPYDLILENTDPAAVKLQIDFYWAHKAKADIAGYFAKWPGRFVQSHLKDATADGDFTTLGAGVLDFPALLAQARKAGIRHQYVEIDSSADPMRAIRESFFHLEGWI